MNEGKKEKKNRRGAGRKQAGGLVNQLYVVKPCFKDSEHFVTVRLSKALAYRHMLNLVSNISQTYLVLVGISPPCCINRRFFGQQSLKPRSCFRGFEFSNGDVCAPPHIYFRLPCSRNQV